MQNIDVMIPVYRPDVRLRTCVGRLLRQEYPVRCITLLISRDGDKCGDWEAQVYQWFQNEQKVVFETVDKQEFNHGSSRNEWASESDADVLLFMVQDAVPADRCLTKYLIDGMIKTGAAIAYARHLPTPGCSEIERMTRLFNYPSESTLKQQQDKHKMGIKWCFTSNVCAAYNRQWFERIGGFEPHVLSTEDSIFAARVLSRGGTVYYCAEAKVVHAHDYDIRQQWVRNFHIGMMHHRYRQIFGRLRASREGLRMVRQCSHSLIRKQKYGELIPLWEMSLIKYAGYWCGKGYEAITEVSKMRRERRYE